MNLDPISMTSGQPVKILLLVARLNIGGPALHVVLLSEHLNSSRYETFLAYGKVGAGEGDMSYLLEDRRIHYSVIDHFGREISFWDDIKTMIQLLIIIKKFKPHILHTHTAKAGTLGRLAGICFNLFRRSGERTRLVHTFHGHVFQGYFNPVKTWVFIQIERMLTRFTDRIIVISPLQKEDICRKYKIAKNRKVEIVPLGFDLAVLARSHPEEIRRTVRARFVSPGREDQLLLGIIGRLTSIKNHSMFLKSLKYIHDKGNAFLFKALIIGDGELRSELEQLARALGMRDSVIFTGWQRDLIPFYQSLDVVALTSKNEGTPVTLLEAMAGRKPVIATDVGGVRDIMGAVLEKTAAGFTLTENGILVPSEESEIFGEALLFLAHHRERAEQMAAHAQAHVLKCFSKERMIQDIESLYQYVISD